MNEMFDNWYKAHELEFFVDLSQIVIVLIIIIVYLFAKARNKKQ